MSILVILLYIPAIVWIPLAVLVGVKFLQFTYNAAFRVDRFQHCGLSRITEKIDAWADSSELPEEYLVAIAIIYLIYLFAGPFICYSAFWHDKYIFGIEISPWWVALLLVPLLPVFAQMVVDAVKRISCYGQYLKTVEEKLEKLSKDLEK